MNRNKFLLVMIFILGFLLRFWRIEYAPPGLNRDEASIAYTAYSLYKTGKDEYGKTWPISFKSFGDWKLPLYIYLDVPFVKVLGLNDTAARLPSVILSSLTIFIVYFLSKELLQNMNKLSLLSTFLFALSPWSIHLSRNASESSTAVFFTSLGLLLYLRANYHKLYLLLGTFFLVLPLYTYHGNHIFTLLLYIGLTVLFWKSNKTKISFWLSIGIFIALSFFIYSRTLFVADRTKISGLFASGDPALVYEKVTTDRLQHIKFSNFTANLFHNKLLFTTISTLQNYIRGYSPEFLFITGGGNTQHNIPDFGNLYLWEVPFLLLGFSYLLVLRNNRKSLILWWLIIAPVAASITKDAPHTNRMAPVLPLLSIVVAIGFMKVVNYLKIRRKSIFILPLGILTILFIANFTIWTDRYFIHFPLKRAAFWGEGYTKLVSYLRENNNFEAKEVVMSRPEYSPYIYFLFYDKVDPSHFQNTVVRYPQTDEGFQHVLGFDNFSFRQIDWADDLSVPNKLYIDWASEVPKGATNSGILITKELFTKLQKNKKDTSSLKPGDFVVSQKMGDINLQSGEPMFTLIKTFKTNE